MARHWWVPGECSAIRVDGWCQGLGTLGENARQAAGALPGSREQLQLHEKGQGSRTTLQERACRKQCCWGRTCKGGGAQSAPVPAQRAGRRAAAMAAAAQPRVRRPRPAPHTRLMYRFSPSRSPRPRSSRSRRLSCRGRGRAEVPAGGRIRVRVLISQAGRGWAVDAQAPSPAERAARCQRGRCARKAPAAGLRQAAARSASPAGIRSGGG